MRARAANGTFAIEDREEVIHHRRARRNAHQNRLQMIVNSAKSRPCTDCGVQYPSYVMDLDHIRGEKVMAVGAMVARSVSYERLRAEIAKCDVVCSNCHRERTHGA